jgi:hypothetical protein
VETATRGPPHSSWPTAPARQPAILLHAASPTVCTPRRPAPGTATLDRSHRPSART